MPDWSGIHRENQFGRWTLPLALCSALYGLGVRLRLHGYSRGVFRKKSLPGFVVSVGNLTAGGTGKTPAAVMLARWALGQGHRVAILSRGYRAQNKEQILEVSNGEGKYADARNAGDEPSLLAREVPGSPVIISRSRYRAGMYAHRKFESDFFILDDGYQHLELERNLNLVLIDALDPFGNGHLLPWGPLREPLQQLRRADAIILTRFSKAERVVNSGQRTLTSLRERFTSIPVFCADHLPHKVVFPASDETYDPGFLREKRVVAFAGIGNPESFKKTLIGLGSNVIHFERFRDHYLFKEKDMEALIHVKETSGAHYLITTQKDWMRIAPVAPRYACLAYLSIRFNLLPGQDGILGMIRDGLRK
ncbi:MAG: tetraacyldisaccharide 4'-kinase [Deltaproteobacteria bacterium]|nr:tetraacyldisaccharide 4'-kinase [Deltaproteobacteria bacterium]